ncbi:MAG: hypothetical protein ACF8GE_01370 [Phycisphaerales bacterium JB043]
MNARNLPLQVMVVLVLLVSTCGVWAQANEDEIRRLLDPQLDAQQRDGMIDRLLGSSSYESLERALERSPRVVAGPLLERVLAVDASERTSEMFRLVLRGASLDPEEHLETALAIVRAHHHRDAIRVCVELLEHDAVRDSSVMLGLVMDVLEHQTGQTGMGRDPEEWTRWWSQVEWLPQVQWLEMLVEAHATRAGEALDIIARQRAQIVDMYSKVYAQSSDDQRGTLVSELLSSPSAQMRLAGLDLIERGVVNGRMPGRTVQGLIVTLLGDADQTVRSRAAVVAVRSLSDPPGDALVRALEEETQESVAFELMALVARWPSEQNVELIWRWVDVDTMRARCVEALTSAALGGVLDQPSRRRRALDVIGDVRWDSATSEEVRLAGALGDRATLERVCESLPSMGGVTRLEAIRVVLRHGVMGEQLARACATDETILVRVRDELRTIHPDAHGLRMLIECCRGVEPGGAGSTSTRLVMGFLRGLPEETQRSLIDSVTLSTSETALWDESLRRQLNASLQASDPESGVEESLDGTS